MRASVSLFRALKSKFMCFFQEHEVALFDFFDVKVGALSDLSFSAVGTPGRALRIRQRITCDGL